jgi:hypothetical protein
VYVAQREPTPGGPAGVGVGPRPQAPPIQLPLWFYIYLLDCLTDCTISPALPQCPTTAAELFSRHARPSRTKVVALTRNDTCEAQRAAMEYTRSWREKSAPEIEIGHGKRSPATTRLKARFNHVPIVSLERLLHTFNSPTSFVERVFHCQYQHR